MYQRAVAGDINAMTHHQNMRVNINAHYAATHQRAAHIAP